MTEDSNMDGHEALGNGPILVVQDLNEMIVHPGIDEGEEEEQLQLPPASTRALAGSDGPWRSRYQSEPKHRAGHALGVA